MGIILSIIVPIYNVEQYLAKCIDSLLNQDLLASEYEILLIDDGSTDNSGQIADNYKKNHSNIRVFHQNNQGLSGARNTGIVNAQGKYIQFVDSDDYIEPNVLKTLVEKMDADRLDVLRFDYQNVNERGEVFQPYRKAKAFVDFSENVCAGSVFLTERLGYACYVCQFIIRTNLITKNLIYFKEGILFEDTEWTPRLLNDATRVTSISLVVYDYLFRSGSITQAKTLEQQQKVLDAKINLVQELIIQSSFASDKRWYKGMIAFIVLSSLSLLAGPLYSIRRQYIQILKELDIFPVTLFHATKRNSRKLKLINLSPELFCIIFHIKEKE